MLFGVALTYILSDVTLALAALVVGFASALFYRRYVDGVVAQGASPPDDPVGNQQAANEAERTSMAVEQVRALTESVAIDVDQHNQVVTDFNQELGAYGAADPQSSSELAVAVGKMVAANARLQSRLEDAEQKIRSQAEEIRIQQSEARTDALTNLANRRAFDDAVAVCVDRFSASRQPFSLILLDVDHFKAFNDKHGHLAGDEVLRQVSRTLQQVVKKSDSPCRYGGEEFAVVMPNSKVGQGRIAAERIRTAIETMTVDFEGETLKVTASVGVAEIAAGEPSSTFIRRTDDAVYAAKKAGRNNSHWHDGSGCLPIGEESAPQGRARPDVPRAADEFPGKRDRRRVADRAAFYRELGRRVAECHRFDVTLSVMQLRVQQYLTLKQNYGDAMGELILDSVAGFVDSTLREMDLIATPEPGLFAVMLPGSNEKEAGQVGRRIQTAISNCVIPLPKSKLRIAVDLGIATVEPGDDAEGIVARAAAMLEQAAKVEVEATGPIG